MLASLMSFGIDVALTDDPQSKKQTGKAVDDLAEGARQRGPSSHRSGSTSEPY